ncbi:MAG: NUDIX domain-containing protein [Bacteroidales bacterium]|jgi:8-oxo-dGTP pyrophosphatase MutT (NUDIX family)|nr:NUDIX domain-containing protein [Bacteroidales bacterium]
MQNYKVFINDKWIFFGEFKETQFTENGEYNVLDASEFLVLNMVEMIKTGSFDSNIVLNHHCKSKEFFNLFLSRFLVLKAAGGIVQNSDKSFLMIKRFGIWDFPKGKIEDGESNMDAALREVEEETSAKNLTPVRELPTTYHIYRFGIQRIVKQTFWFLMQSDYKGQLIPQKEEDILEAVWISERELPKYIANSYESLKELVKDSEII